MKFATRISSIRRQAWKQCRSCSADSDSMCADSLASARSRGGRARPRPRARGDRVLRQPVDLQVGMQRAQLLGDRDVAAGVAEADRRGDEQRALAGALRPRVHVRARGRRRSTKSRSSRLTFTGSRACGPWPAPSSVTSSPPVALGQRGALGVRADQVLVAVDHEHGAARRGPRCRANSSRAAQAQRGRRVGQRLGVGLERPADAVLDLLGRVRLGEHLREEELEEAAVVLAASSGGCTSPSPRRCRAPPRSARRSRAPGWPGASGTAGPM